MFKSQGLNGVELVEAQTKFKTAKDSAANTITISLGDIQSEEVLDLFISFSSALEVS